MERDFLGIGGQQNSGAPMKKENRMDSAISIGSAAPWPFSNKANALEQFMSFQPIASVDAYEASRKASAPEKSLGVERQFAAHSYQNQGSRDSTRKMNDARSDTIAAHSYQNPTATAVKQQQPLGSVAISPRKKAQLTIFYAGSVKVYDDVSCDMAKAIMLMASRECETVHQSSGLSSAVSIASHSDSGSGPANDKAAAKKSNLTQISTSQKAVPQARKASLARFLEKRKERVSNMMPYNSCEKKHSDAHVSIPSNQGGSWCVGQTKSCSGNGY